MTAPAPTTTERREFGTLRRRGRIWYYRYSVGGKTYEVSSRSTSQKQAQRLLDKARAELEAGVHTAPDARRVRFADFVRWLEEDYRKKDNRSIDRVRQALAHLEKVFGHRRAIEITADRISTYTVARLDSGAARSTVNYELAVLRHAFNLGIEHNRLASAPTIKTPSPKNARQGFFEPDDFAAVLAELPDYLKPVMQFAYLTGWRVRSEVLTLTWDRVDFNEGLVRLDPNTTKDKKGREFPFGVLPDLEAVLSRQRERTTAIERATAQRVPFVFHRNGSPIRNYYAAWRAACKRATLGTKAGPLTLVGHSNLLGRMVHDFRRTSVRNLVRAGVPEGVAMRLSGHATRTIFDRYNIVNADDLRTGVAKLATHLAGSAPPVAKGTDDGQMPSRFQRGA